MKIGFDAKRVFHNVTGLFWKFSPICIMFVIKHNHLHYLKIYNYIHKLIQSKKHIIYFFLFYLCDKIPVVKLNKAVSFMPVLFN